MGNTPSDSDIYKDANDEQKENINANISDITKANRIINDNNSTSDQINNAKTLKKMSTIKLFSTVSDVLKDSEEVKNSFNVFGNKDFDITKDWTSESQTALNDEGKNQLENLKKSKVWKSLNDRLTVVNSMVDSGTLEKLQTFIKSDDPQQLDKTLNDAVTNVGDKLSDSQKDEIEKRTGTSWQDLIKYLLMLGAIVGGITVSIISLNKWLCNMAKKDSGCKVTSPDGENAIALVWTQGMSCGATQDCSYDGVCGSCGDSNQPSPNSPPCCCSSAVDADATKHAGWQYQYVCSNIWDQLSKVAKSLLSDLNPMNLLNDLEKIAKTIGIGIVILLGVVIVFYIIKFGIRYAEKRLETEENSGE